MIDLTITPQLSKRTPGDHLTDDEAAQVWADWANYGQLTGPTEGMWTIAIVHIINDAPTVTSVARIPRSSTTHGDPASAPQLSVINGGATTTTQPAKRNSGSYNQAPLLMAVA